MELTYVDRVILKSYSLMLEGLSEYLGSGYEFVLHSLEDYNHSVIKIINGYHTGRAEGAPITNLALSMLEKINGQSNGSGSIAYFSTNKKKEPLKSTTITIQGENKRIIGLLCINFYLNTPLNQVVEGLVRADAADQPAPASSVENFAQNFSDMIESSVAEVRQEVYGDHAIAANCKNKEIVKRLSEMGVFRMKDAVVIAAQLLGISKNTIYMHLRNLEGE